MITIPLATVVAYLQRKGAGVACLEGAPTVIGIAGYRGNMVAFDAEKHADWRGPGDLLLYLGRDAVCPAAMGWAAAVLSSAMNTTMPAVLHDAFNDDGGGVCLWGVAGRLNARWTWTAGSAMGRSFREVQILGTRPLTPAARLLAVLEYEMGRP